MEQGANCEHHGGSFDKQIYHKRNIDCSSSFVALLLAMKNRTINFLAMITLASILSLF
jgi:hypothetical protein